MPWTVADVEEHKAGLTAAQKRQWINIANSVLRKCVADGGKEATCAASAIRQANGVVGHAEMQLHGIKTARYEVRTELHQGKKHLVLPVVMMVEGVHNGSHGPILHLADELGHFPEAWNGIPVTVQHPTREGQSVSANTPEVIDSVTVGRVYNTKMDGNKLRGEVWLDEARLTQVSPQALAYIRAGRNLEVSVGVFSDDDETTGTWNDEEYVGVARNHRPDHLALLPGGVGACSWADGCGVRNNAKEGGEITDLLEKIKQLSVEGYAALQINAVLQGFREVMQAIQGKLDRMDDDMKVHFLQEVYKDYFIYEVRGRQSGGEAAMYRRDYTKNADGSIEFTGEPVTVTRRVEYVTNSGDNEFRRTKGGKMSENKKPCCPEKVKLLVQSKHTPFQETDKEWLETMEEIQLDKLADMAKMLEKEPTPPSVAQVNREQAIQVLREELATPDKFIALLPEELQDSVRSGLRLNQEKRQQMIAAIMQANGKVYTEEKLKTKTSQELEELVSWIPAKVDYSAQAGGSQPVVNTAGGVLLPPGVEAK